MFFGKKGRVIKSIAFDCGTSGVRAALFSYDKKDVLTKPEVLDVIRVPFSSATQIDAHYLRRKTKESIRHILKAIPALFQPEEVIMGLTTPYYVAKTIKIAKQRADERSLITGEEFSQIQLEAQRTFEEEMQKRMSGDILIFATLLQKIFINGYRIEHPVGNAGKIIETSFRFEATTKEIHEDFTNILAHHFHNASIRFFSIALANVYALRATQEEDQGFLLIDVGGEITEVALASEGVLEQVTSLPLGHSMLVREVAGLPGLSFPDAMFIVNRYTEKTLESEKQKKFMPLFAEFQSSWRKKLLAILAVYAQQYEIPAHIYFSGCGVLPFHKDIFSEDVFRSLLYGKNPVVEIATVETLSRQFGKQSFETPMDFGVASLALLGARTVV